MPAKPKPPDKWYSTSLTKISGAIFGLTTIFGMGFSTGMAYSKNERTLDEIKIRAEYEAKIQQIVDECRSEKITEYKKVTEKLESTLSKMVSKR